MGIQSCGSFARRFHIHQTQHRFYTLQEARVLVEQWRMH